MASRASPVGPQVAQARRVAAQFEDASFDPGGSAPMAAASGAELVRGARAP